MGMLCRTPKSLLEATGGRDLVSYLFQMIECSMIP